MGNRSRQEAGLARCSTTVSAGIRWIPALLMAVCLTLLADTPRDLRLPLVSADGGALPARGDTCGVGHACRFWGTIGSESSDSLVLDHLLTGDNTLQDLAASNPHGWGLGYFSPILNAPGWVGPAFARGGSEADHDHDTRYEDAITQLVALDPTCAIAHVRNSSGSHTGVPDPHPFWREGLALAHNGGIDVDELVTLLEEGDPDFLATHHPTTLARRSTVNCSCFTSSRSENWGRRAARITG